MRPVEFLSRAPFLYRRRQTLRRLFLFGTVSVVATLVDLAVFNALLIADAVPRWVATTTGYSVGLVVNYVLNRWITFRGGGRARRTEEFGLFVVISAVVLLVHNLAVEVVARTISESAILLTVARILVAAATWTVKFFVVQRWVFPERSAGAERVSAERVSADQSLGAAKPSAHPYQPDQRPGDPPQDRAP